MESRIKNNVPMEIPNSYIKKQLDRLIEMVRHISQGEGTTETVIPFLSVSIVSEQAPSIPSIVTPSFCLVLQGAKVINVGDKIIQYHAGDYLASVIDIPASGQVIGVTKESPYIGLRVDFSSKEISSLVVDAEINIKSENTELGMAAFIGKSDPELLELLIRLLKLPDNPNQAHFLSALFKREMIYRLLTGNYGHMFLQQALFDQQSDGIGKAIGWIKGNFSKSFTVKELARISNMSISNLHHKFKMITTMGPLQYQKQLRLLEARRLMLSGKADAATTAMEVGYESPSQFSREYRRLFGLPPMKDMRAIKGNLTIR